MGIPEHLTCLLRNLYAGQEVTVRTRHGTMDWYVKAVYCHHAYGRKLRGIEEPLDEGEKGE